MPIKIIRVPRDRGFASALPIHYQDPRFAGATVTLTKAFVQRQLLLPLVLPHLRMLPAILRMIVPAVSDESRARGTPGREPAARWFTLDRRSHGAGAGRPFAVFLDEKIKSDHGGTAGRLSAESRSVIGPRVPWREESFRRFLWSGARRVPRRAPGPGRHRLGLGQAARPPPGPWWAAIAFPKSPGHATRRPPSRRRR